MTQETDRIVRVGFCGLGTMGTPMARNVATKCRLAGVWNRTASVADRFAASTGTTAYATPRDLAAACDVVVSMVSDAAAVAAVADGPSGLLAGLRPGTVWIEMSTLGPAPLPALGARVRDVGCEIVDAPVSGSVAVAEQAALTILVGGGVATVERVRPVLAAMGERIIHLGPLGAGATMKLVVNSLIFATNEAVAEALVLAEAAGVEPEAAYDVFEASAAVSPVMRYRRRQFLEPDEAPTSFRLALAAKDLALIRALAATHRTAMPQLEAAAAVVDGAIDGGLAEADLALVARHLRRLGSSGAC